MSVSRREAIKVFGVGLASLMLLRCRTFSTPTPSVVTCYTIAPITPEPPPLPTPLPSSFAPRERIRLCWGRFDQLAAATLSGQNQGSDSWDDPFGQQMLADHRAALDELVEAEELESNVADLVQDAFGAAVFHVWRSNTPITCYEAMMVDYAPTSAEQLVRQAETLTDLAQTGNLDPDTVALARETIEHDLAFEALTYEEVSALYEKIIAEAQQNPSDIPPFEEVELTVTPEMEKAAQFLADVLTGQ